MGLFGSWFGFRYRERRVDDPYAFVKMMGSGYEIMPEVHRERVGPSARTALAEGGGLVIKRRFFMKRV
jgi:hypothetical protein